MDEEEQNRYVSQLKAEFDSCDTTGTGYLDKEELTALCGKLHLEAHLPLLLDTLLGPHHYSRVNFEEFKEGFVAVLSRSLDLSTSEDDTSYLEPVVAEEVKPKFVKGTKRYGRRTRPDGPDSEPTGDSEETSPPLRLDQAELFPSRGSMARLRRSTSLESVESLKSDEEAVSTKDTSHQTVEAQGQLKRRKRDSVETPLPSPGPQPNASDVGGLTPAVWELGVGGDSFLTKLELSVVCKNLGLQGLGSEELNVLFRRLDKDKEGRVSLSEFQRSLFKPGSTPAPVLVPTSCSTPIRLLPQRSLTQDSPSIHLTTVGQSLLSQLDDGSGFTSPDNIIAAWSDEGIHNGKEILQTLDFPLDQKVSLAELTLELDNELRASGNGILQAALVSYKKEIQFLQVQAEQACRERDKAKSNLDYAEKLKLQVVREVEDQCSTLEMLNETKIRGLEQEYRDRLMTLRKESEQETVLLLQQVEQERSRLQEEVEKLQMQDISLREEISASNKENHELVEELSTCKEEVTKADRTISKLQNDLDRFCTLDQNHTRMNPEERFSVIIKEYELQCQELRDRNDELSSELQILMGKGGGRKTRRDSLSSPIWCRRRAFSVEFDSADDPEMKRGTSPMERKQLLVADKNGLGSLENIPVPANMSLETELALEQLREQHDREVQDLKIQLETKVNFYERSLELMQRNMEVERKDISQAFKMEISQLEEQKAQVEERAERMRESLVELRAQAQVGAWGPEQERRAQRERAELEQNYAREISNLVGRLTSEKDQLETELKLKMDEEVCLLREEEEEKRSQMKAQHAEAQRALLHQLHCERVQLQEQKEHLHRATLDRKQLGAELQEARCQLEDCVGELGSLEALVQQLNAELSHMQEEKDSLMSSRSSLTATLSQKEALVRSKEEELDLLRRAAEENQEVLQSRGEQVLRLTAAVRSVVEDRARLAQELEQARMTQESGAMALIQPALVMEREESRHLSLQITPFSDWPSAQIAKMKAESAPQLRGMGLCLGADGRDEAKWELWNHHLEARLMDQLKELVQEKLATPECKGAERCGTFQRLASQLKKRRKKVEQLELSTPSGLESDGRLQRAVGEIVAEVRSVQAEFREEKNKMVKQLQQMEQLVMALEVEMDQAELHRKKLELENNREEVEQLLQENSQYREEVLELSSRNLQLSGENAELSARLRADQGAVQQLTNQLAHLSREQEDGAAVARQLQETTDRMEREQQQLQSAWDQERELLLAERDAAKEKLQSMVDVEAELTSLTLQHELLGKEEERLRTEAEDKSQKMDMLQDSVRALTSQMAASQGLLQEAKDKVKELEASVDVLQRQKEDQSQSLLQQVDLLQAKLEKVTQECQTLKSRQAQLEKDVLDSQDQLLKANAALTQAQSQHAREVQQLREQNDAETREQLAHAHAQLAEEKRRALQQEEQMMVQASTQMTLQKEQYEKAVKAADLKMENLRAKLNKFSSELQDKANRLQERMAKNTKSDLLVKDLYVENSQLMKALQVTEERQKSAEKNNYLLEEKNAALNNLLRRIASMTSLGM